MSTMNFSTPDDIKERFNQAFADVNKSAIVAKLMEVCATNCAQNPS